MPEASHHRYVLINLTRRAELKTPTSCQRRHSLRTRTPAWDGHDAESELRLQSAFVERDIPAIEQWTDAVSCDRQVMRRRAVLIERSPVAVPLAQDELARVLVGLVRGEGRTARFRPDQPAVLGEKRSDGVFGAFLRAVVGYHNNGLIDNFMVICHTGLPSTSTIGCRLDAEGARGVAVDRENPDVGRSIGSSLIARAPGGPAPRAA